MKLLLLALNSFPYFSCLFLQSRRLLSSVSTNQFKWNSTTSVIITNPTLIIMESCSTMSQLKQIQAHMTRSGLIAHTFPVSRVLAFCALADGGDIRYAHVLFNHIEKPNTYMWNTMIRGYCKAKIPISAFSFFRRMVGEGEHVGMDRRSFVFALKSCERFDTVFEGESVHCLVCKMGFEAELLVRNGLIHFYADRGCLELAREVFDESSLRDVVTWTSMIDGYAARNYSEEAMNLFKMMLSSGIEPNEVTFIALLSACSKECYLRMGKSIHEFLEKKRNKNRNLSLHNALLDMYVKCNCLPAARELFDKMESRDVFSWTSMVNGYAKCGDLESARQFFDQTPEKNVVTWNALISGYSQNNKPMEAVNLFNEMIEAGMIPVEQTLVSVLSACGQLSFLNLGQWIHKYFISSGRTHLTVTLANAFMDMYAKCGCIDAATEIFNTMTRRDLVSWNSMIAAYATNGRAEQAMNLFDQMVFLGFKPDDITFVNLLTACSHGGLVSAGRECFESMGRNYGIEPKREHYSCMIDLLGRIGLLEEAYKLITNMPMEPCEAAWGALLNACKMHGNVELARLSAGNVLSIDPKDSGIYVLLANICAKERSWGDVKTARSLMREKGVKKIPGLSLVEIEGEFLEFLVADESHPQSEEIYKILNEIYFLAKLEDYRSRCDPPTMTLQYWDDF